ncbi:MAG: PepSY-like domain-containing protein [Bacteroidia bacterium]
MIRNCLKICCYKILFIFLLLFSFSVKPASAQESEAYEKTFKEKFPTVTAPMWIRKANDTFEATFKLNGAFVSSVFTPDGKWLFTKMPVDTSKIPTVVMNGIAKKYPGSKITFAEKSETADKGIQYQVSLKTGTKKADALFDEEGNFVK